MILALLFLPLVLVVITVGLPVLIFLLSVAAMFILSYQRIVSIYSECQDVFWRIKTTKQLSPTRSMPHAGKARVSRRFPHSSRRSVSPTPALWTIPESPTASVEATEPDKDFFVPIKDWTLRQQRVYRCNGGIVYTR
jgi:hypothetical protein